MTHPLEAVPTSVVQRSAEEVSERIEADVCVVGAGISGLSAALEARRLGRRVVLVDALPVLGGQCVNSLIGLFCGVYGNADAYRQLTHGVFDRLFADLEPTGDVQFNRRHTMTVTYDEAAVGRWFENRIAETGVEVLVGAVILRVHRTGGRIEAVDFASRYGTVRVSASAFVDASGDAALTWEAGFGCKVPDRPIWGSQQIRIEQCNEAAVPAPADLVAAIAAHADEYGLVRRDGLAFVYAGRGTAVLNMTHVPSPLSAIETSRAQLDGRAQADRVHGFLKAEFPEAFGASRVHSYGLPGRRQARWIDSEHELTVEEVRAGTRFDDAVARTAWPIELHDRAEGYSWEVFGPDHVHYVPLRSMTPRGAENLLAVGRCVDGDAAALSSVRVMGPCAAMGHAAAHVFDLADGGAVGAVDLGALRGRIAENLGEAA